MKTPLLLLIAASSGIVGLVAPAIAAPPGWSDFKDSTGNIYVGATTVNGEIQIDLGSLLRLISGGWHFERLGNIGGAIVLVTVTEKPLTRVTR